MQDRYEWGLIPKIFLFLRTGEKKGSEFLSIANYQSALKQLNELTEMGLVEHRVEPGARNKPGHRYTLTAEGYEIAKFIEQLDDILQQSYHKKEERKKEIKV